MGNDIGQYVRGFVYVLNEGSGHPRSKKMEKKQKLCAIHSTWNIVSK